MKGSQTAGTEVGLNWIGYTIHHAPGLMMLVNPSLDMVKRNTSTRIDPLIASTPELAKKVVAPRSKEAGNSIFRKKFPGGELVMTGANSPRDCARRRRATCFWTKSTAIHLTPTTKGIRWTWRCAVRSPFATGEDLFGIDADHQRGVAH